MRRGWTCSGVGEAFRPGSSGDGHVEDNPDDDIGIAPLCRAGRCPGSPANPGAEDRGGNDDDRRRQGVARLRGGGAISVVQPWGIVDPNPGY